jgi:hypothetical protein
MDGTQRAEAASPVRQDSTDRDSFIRAHRSPYATARPLGPIQLERERLDIGVDGGMEAHVVVGEAIHLRSLGEDGAELVPRDQPIIVRVYLHTLRVR